MRLITSLAPATDTYPYRTTESGSRLLGRASGSRLLGRARSSCTSAFLSGTTMKAGNAPAATSKQVRIWPASSVCLATGSDSPWVTRTALPYTCIVGTRKVAIGIPRTTPSVTPSNNRPVRTLVTPSRYPETGPCWPSARRTARARFECSGGTPRGHLGLGWESTSWDPTARTSPRDSAPR